MKWNFAAAFAVLVAFATGNGAVANDIQQAAYNSSCCENVCDLGCDSRCNSGGPYAEFDLLFLRYHRADGVRQGSDVGESGDFGFETSPRITLGYVGDDGLGARIRYWEYNHFQTIMAPGGVGVDSYNLDFELFERFDLNCDWDLELSGGFRFSDQQEFMIDQADIRANTLDSALGLIIGAEARRQIGFGSLFGRIRTAIVQGDKLVFNDDAVAAVGAEQRDILIDSTSVQLELAIGHEISLATRGGTEFFGRYGLEWWQYDNVTSSFGGPLAGGPVTPVNREETFGGPSDAGYAGFMFSVGMRR